MLDPRGGILITLLGDKKCWIHTEDSCYRWKQSNTAEPYDVSLSPLEAIKHDVSLWRNPCFPSK